MNESPMIEIITDLYRDLILTGILVSIGALIWRASGWKSTIESMHSQAIQAIERLRISFGEFKEENHATHTDIRREIEKLKKDCDD